MLVLLQSLANSLAKLFELYLEFLLVKFAELEKAQRAPLLQLAIPEQHVYFQLTTNHVRTLLDEYYLEVKMSLLFSSALRFSRLRTITSCKPQTFSSCQGICRLACIRLRSTFCLNNTHQQFYSRTSRPSSFSCDIPTRTITYYSRRKGKRKTVKAVVRRFRRTGSGKWKRWQAGKNHFNSKKTSKRRSRLRRYVICNKQQTKMLNKMVNGW